MGSHPKTPLWLDCDTGHDDALAILLAARSTEVNLLGISTVYGNAPLARTTYNTRAILKAIDREVVPVYAGAEKPFKREAVHAPGIHGESGLDGTTCLPVPTVPAREDVSAVEAMYRALKAEDRGTAWVVATGALTNIAAQCREHPDVIEHIAGLSIMGGAVGGGFTNAPMGKVSNEEGERFGNWTPYAEFNIYCDPESASEIFSNEALARKTTLIPLDLTHQFLATGEIQMGLLFGFRGTRYVEPTLATVSNLRRLFFEIMTFFAKTYADVFGLHAGPPTHDPLAVAVAVRPQAFYCNREGLPGGYQDERFYVQVVTDGEHGSESGILNGPSQCGRTIVTATVPGEGGVRIPRGLASRDMWLMIEGCLTRTEQALQRSHADDVKLMRPIPELTAFANMTNLLHGRNTWLSELEAGQGLPDLNNHGVPENGEYISTQKAPGIHGAFVADQAELRAVYEFENRNAQR